MTRGGATIPDCVEPELTSESETLLDAVERAALEQVRRVHGVPAFAEDVGEPADSIGQALDVVIQQHVGHGVISSQ